MESGHHQYFGGVLCECVAEGSREEIERNFFSNFGKSLSDLENNRLRLLAKK